MYRVLHITCITWYDAGITQALQLKFCYFRAYFFIFGITLRVIFSLGVQCITQVKTRRFFNCNTVRHGPVCSNIRVLRHFRGKVPLKCLIFSFGWAWPGSIGSVSHELHSKVCLTHSHISISQSQRGAYVSYGERSEKTQI